MAPIRLELTARLSQALGLFDHVTVIDPEVASDEQLERLHDPAYVAAVRQFSLNPVGSDPERGLGTDDVPVFAGMHEASARIVGGSMALADAILSGDAEHGVNFTGGLHHAMPAKADGFCIYNDAALAIQRLLDNGVERVAYIDVDVHHGDGVERMFWDEPRVLTASVHQSGRTLFPGTGWPRDIGGEHARGTAVNIALPPGTRDSQWLRAINSAIIPVVQAFDPQVIVSQHGADSHIDDPLAHLAISLDAHRYAMDTIHRLSHQLTDGKWIALGGGGYEVVSVVPLSWSHLIGVAAHHPVPLTTPVPEEWRIAVKELTGREAPTRMGDLDPNDGPIWVQPWEMGYNPHSDVDRAIMATREAVFPLHGLDVWFT